MDNRQSGKLTLAFSKVELKSEKQQEHQGFRLQGNSRTHTLCYPLLNLSRLYDHSL